MRKPRKDVFTTGEVARMCEVASRTVSKWCDNGFLDHYQIPGSNDRRIPRKSLIKFLTKHNMPIVTDLAEVEAFDSLVKKVLAYVDGNKKFVKTLSDDEIEALRRYYHPRSSR